MKPPRNTSPRRWCPRRPRGNPAHSAAGRPRAPCSHAAERHHQQPGVPWRSLRNACSWSASPVSCCGRCSDTMTMEISSSSSRVRGGHRDPHRRSRGAPPRAPVSPRAERSRGRCRPRGPAARATRAPRPSTRATRQRRVTVPQHHALASPLLHEDHRVAVGGLADGREATLPRAPRAVADHAAVVVAAERADVGRAEPEARARAHRRGGLARRTARAARGCGACCDRRAGAGSAGTTSTMSTEFSPTPRTSKQMDIG